MAKPFLGRTGSPEGRGVDPLEALHWARFHFFDRLPDATASLPPESARCGLLRLGGCRFGSLLVRSPATASAEEIEIGAGLK